MQGGFPMTVDALGRVSQLDALLDRLEDPAVAASLNSLLDRAELIAFIFEALDGLVRRAEEIGDSVVEGVSDLKALAGTSFNGQRLADLKPGEILSSVLALSMALPRVTPAVTQVLDAGIADPPVVEQIAKLGRGVLAGAEKAKTEPIEVKGPLSLLRALKDPDIARGVGFFLSVAKAIGAGDGDQVTPASSQGRGAV